MGSKTTFSMESSASGRVAQPTRSRWAAMALLLGIALAGTAAWAQGDPPGRVGRIADTQGKVWIYDDEGSAWTEVTRNQPITSGDRLATDNGARAEVRVGSTVFRIGAATDIEVQRLDDERIAIGMTDGTMAMRIRSQDNAREVEINTAEGRFVPLTAGHYRVDRQEGRLDGTSWLGDMRYEGGQTSTQIPAGRRAALSFDAGAARVQWGDVERDEFSDWVARDDRSQDTRTTSRYVSPEMTGAEDLDQYGEWDNNPEYGAIWTPRQVSADWAPYRYGRWTWVAPWGWTWVDDQPWGFAPSHYGRWVSWRNRWSWVPGAYVARPVYSPALVGWFGGSHVSLSFSIGGPAVGWVPLAPREVYRPVYVVTPVYWQRLNPHAPYQPHRPTGPIMYSNRGVPGGVTVVSANTLRDRQPVAYAYGKVDVKDRQAFIDKSVGGAEPVAPAGRPVAGTRPAPVKVVAAPPNRPQRAEPNRGMGETAGPARGNGATRPAAVSDEAVSPTRAPADRVTRSRDAQPANQPVAPSQSSVPSRVGGNSPAPAVNRAPKPATEAVPERGQPRPVTAAPSPRDRAVPRDAAPVANRAPAPLAERAPVAVGERAPSIERAPVPPVAERVPVPTRDAPRDAVRERQPESRMQVAPRVAERSERGERRQETQ